MSDAAAQIARYATILDLPHIDLTTKTLIYSEAKSLQVGLKELLKTHDVLDKEIEIQRKKCVCSCSSRLRPPC